MTGRAIKAIERVILLPRAETGWRGLEIVRCIHGPPGAHFVRACSKRVYVQWDAHMGCFAEVRPS